jgi:hypothetical protein
MRNKVRAWQSAVLIACWCGAAVAEEPRTRWWPFGGQSEAEAVEEHALPAAWPQATPAAAELESAGSAAGGSAAYPSTSYPSTPYPTAGADATAALEPHESGAVGDYSTEEYSERRWMFQSPLMRISWPRIHMPAMPRLPRPQLWPRKTEVDEARNAWMQSSPDPARPSPLQAVRQGAQRVRESTRSAWRKTVDVLTPGDASSSDSSRIARRETQPFWKRMLTVEEPEPPGPRTIPEWLAQERLEP